MINKRAIDAFLARSLANYDWIKTQSVKALDIAFNPHLGNLFPKLWQHQKACFLIVNELKRFMVHISMGGGKTLLVIALLDYRKLLGEKIKTIVFVPYITSVETWVEEVAKHANHLKCIPLIGTGVENLARLGGDGDLYVVCYQSAVAMLASKKNRKWELAAADVRAAFADFNCVVFDEVHRAKSAHSLTFRMCRALSAQCEWAIGLTGTPFGTDVSDLWPQFYLIDFGETLGSTLTLFREAFFTKKLNYWGGYDYKFQQKKLPLLQQFIKNRSIHYSVDEFIDMPSKTYIQRHLTLPETWVAYAEKALTELKLATKSGNYRLAENSYLRLQQLGSGFMTLHGEDSDKVEVDFDENPKLDALEAILDGIAPTEQNGKVVVFHHFVHAGSLICQRLAQRHIPFACINGGIKRPIDSLRKFKDDPQCRILVINCRSGSSSLNLQIANYVVFFEQPTSPIDRQQAEARCWRPGQSRRVFIYDLLARDTMDHRQHQINQSGENLLQALLSGRIKL